MEQNYVTVTLCVMAVKRWLVCCIRVMNDKSSPLSHGQ